MPIDWVVEPPVKPFAQVRLGTNWCDHVVAHEAAKAGYRVSNPCKTIRCWHVHPDRQTWDHSNTPEDLKRRFQMTLPCLVPHGTLEEAIRAGGTGGRNPLRVGDLRKLN